MKKSTAARSLKAKPQATTTRGQRIDAALEQLSKLSKVLDVGVSGLGALIAYEYLVPEQLSLLGLTAFLIAGLGVVTSWLDQRRLRRHGVRIALTALMLVTCLLILNLWVVQEVPYTDAATGKAETSHLLVGTRLSEFGEQTARQVGSRLPSDIIREAGKDLIPELWLDYKFFAALYVVCFVLFSFFGAMALSAVVERVITRTR